MQATVHRNQGEFSCVVNGTVLLKAKKATGIARVHDMVDAINMGAVPEIITDGRGAERRFTVALGEFIVGAGMSAHAAYKELDRLEEALTPPTFSESVGAMMDATPVSVDMPAVPVPDGAPVYETDDGKGNTFSEGEQP